MWVTRRSREEVRVIEVGLNRIIYLAAPCSPVWILPGGASISAANSCWTWDAG